MSRKTRPAKQTPKPTANIESSAAPTKQEAPMPTPSTSTPPAAAAGAPAATFNGVALNAPTPEIPQAMPAASHASPTTSTPAAQPQTAAGTTPSAPAAAEIPVTVQQAPASPTWPPAIVLPPDPEIPDRAPGHPKTLSLSLNGRRRHKLHALRAVLRTQKATIHTRRGGAEGEQLVLTFNDTLLWLLDQVQIDAGKSDGQ